MIFTFLKGMATGGGLILAIGAQNAFVLSQGVRRHHILVIPLICAICDAILISLGVMGLGRIIASSRVLSLATGLGGAIFLFWYGANAFRSALRGGRLEADQAGKPSLKSAVLATLAVTLLNPHVYIDTIILLGSLAGQFPDPGRVLFGAGAMTASFIWFFTLSIGAGMLAPLFKKEISWRILDSLVGLVMWSIGFSVLRDILARVQL